MSSGCRDCGRAAYGYELCIDCVRRRLAERIRDLVDELLPGGHYERGGREYRHGSGRGLVIVIGGPKSGVWKDWGADIGGDVIGLIARCIGGDRLVALRWARRWLGLPEHRRPARPLPEHVPDDDGKNRRIALRIWQEGPRLQRDDWVWRYLLDREIDLERWARANNDKLPACLRFHPRVWNSETGRELPAMIAAIVGRDARFLALHRTWLEEKNGCITKASLAQQKMTLGNYKVEGGTGCIRLWHPNWHEATDEDILGVSEGIEDAMTAVEYALGEPRLRVAAAVSLSGLRMIWLPSVFDRIVLLGQNDAKPAAIAAFKVVRARFRREGREAWIYRPPRGLKDINEVAMKLAKHRNLDAVGERTEGI